MEVAPPRRRFGWTRRPTRPTYVVVDGDILDVAGHAVTYGLRVGCVHVFDLGILVYVGNKVQKKREILFLQDLHVTIALDGTHLSFSHYISEANDVLSTTTPDEWSCFVFFLSVVMLLWVHSGGKITRIQHKTLNDINMRSLGWAKPPAYYILKHRLCVQMLIPIIWYDMIC